jgi:hypothetical protein
LCGACRAINQEGHLAAELSDLVSLSIVEECARFHIFCAEKLCYEDAHNIDRKLKDENLTKCLRTLKHMYYDLSLEGVFCPRERQSELMIF